MSEYKPGTVAVATVRGVEGVRVFRRHSPDTGVRNWAYNPDPSRGLNYSCDSDLVSVVTDIRPLVVLDLAEIDEDAATTWLEVAENLRRSGTVTEVCIADQIEAQTKPPRIPEPGKYGVVKARYRDYLHPHEWVSDGKHWTNLDTGTVADWANLIDPVEIRKGVA